MPGNAAEKLSRALTRGADALIVDLEDAVPLAHKETALRAVLDWLRSQPNTGGTELWVRTNSGNRGRIETQTLANAPGLTGLALAKAEDPTDILAVSDLLSEAGDTSTRLMPLVETAAALFGVQRLASAPRVQRLQIGEVDLAGDLGLEPSDDERELAPLRALVVAASAAAGIAPPMAPVSVVTRAPEVFAESTRRAKRQGFVGRACIHPAQVGLVHEVFTPTHEEVSVANRTLALAEQAVASGSGVVLDADGRMVDAAVLKAARRTLALARWATV